MSGSTNDPSDSSGPISVDLSKESGLGFLRYGLAVGGQGQGMRMAYLEHAEGYLLAMRAAAVMMPVAWILQKQEQITSLPGWLQSLPLAHPWGWAVAASMCFLMALVCTALPTWVMPESMDATPDAAIMALQEARNVVWGMIFGSLLIRVDNPLDLDQTLVLVCVCAVLLPWAIWNRWRTEGYLFDVVTTPA